MADKFISMELEDEGELFLKMERYENRQRERLKDMVDDMGNYVVLRLIATVPVYDMYTIRHIDRTAVQWRPGGAGGGGSYVVFAGIKAGSSKHPLYAEFGTGIYAGRGLIRPIHGGFVISSRNGGKKNVLTFQKHGEPRRFRPWVRGQKGQHYFYQVWRDTNIYASSRVLTQFNPI